MILRLQIAALTFILGACALIACRTPAAPLGVEPSRAWSAECYIGEGNFRMTISGIDGCTYTARRPVQIYIAPGPLEEGEGLRLHFTVRHELLHVIGWAGHPYASPDDDHVVYMDLCLPHPLPTELPMPSDLERLFVEESPAEIWLTVASDSPALAVAVADAAAFWNMIAGKKIFLLRQNPATMGE